MVNSSFSTFFPQQLPNDLTTTTTTFNSTWLNNTLCTNNTIFCNNTNKHNNNSDSDEELDGACVRLLVPPIFILIVVVGFVGNIFVMLTVIMNKKMRSTTNILIFNLALADLLFILICVPSTGLVYLASRWPLGSIMCKLSQYLLHVTAYASVDTLVLMSLDRYLAVVHPVSSMSIRTCKNALIAVAIMWTVVLLLNTPTLQDYQLYEDADEVLCLNVRVVFDLNYAKVFYSVFFMFGLVIPLVVIIILYTIMVVRLLKLGGTIKGKKSGKELRECKDGVASEARRKSNCENMRAKRRVMKLIIVVVVVFVVCWAPIHIVFLLQFFVLQDIGDNFICIRVFCNCLAYMNSCINPLLYAFFSESFRQNFKNLCSIICFKICRNSERGVRATEMKTLKNRDGQTNTKVEV